MPLSINRMSDCFGERFGVLRARVVMGIEYTSSFRFVAVLYMAVLLISVRAGERPGQRRDASATLLTAARSTERTPLSSVKPRPEPVIPPADKLVRLRVEPSALEFFTGDRPRPVVVSGVLADGFEVDVTGLVRWGFETSGVARMDATNRVLAMKPGSTVAVARLRGVEVRLPIRVESSSGPAPLSFVKDVLPVLSRLGCNAGACHAKPEGQNGFKLSVFSYDPKSDHSEIVREGRGRRVFPANPEESLILKKPTLGVPHEGGARLKAGSMEYQLLVRWIREGMAFEQPKESRLIAVEVFPRERRYRKGASQRLLVRARYSDGTARDVTDLAMFDSNDKDIARVDEGGQMTVGGVNGEGVVVARFMGLVDASRITVPSERLYPESRYAALPVQNFLDPLAYAQFRRLGLLPSDLCSDPEFLRRSSLDATGVLPTPEETREFLASTSVDKRARWVEKLLRKPEYGDYWANKWADLFRPNPDRVGVKSVFLLDQWLRECFRENKPLDQFAREIVLAQGSTHQVGPNVIYRDRREPPELTTLFSQVFLGVRLECARCHHHPNEKWGQEDFYQLAAFFGPMKQKGSGLSPPISAGTEHFYFAPGGSVTHPVTGEVMKPKSPDATAVDVPADRDPRLSLADWMTSPKNPYFSRALVNRVWAVFFGRGIVEPVDDFRVSNPASNDPLLQGLADDFAAHHFDLKHLVKAILESRLYQLSSTPNETNLSDTKNFSRSYRRRLPAEVLFDAVSQVTASRETLAGMVPGARSMEAWTYKIESHFLDAFSRPNSSSDCPCERDRTTSVVQSLHMMNSKGLQSKFTDSNGSVKKLVESGRPPPELVADLYLATFCRLPEPRELEIATRAYEVEGATRQTATEDILWALFNSAEFVFNH